MKNSANIYIKSDLYRYTGSTAWNYFIKTYINNRLFRFQVALRLKQGTNIQKLVGNFLWLFNTTRHLVQIHKETKIGYGLYIGHYGSIVVSPSTIIGNNCNLSHSVTIGANDGNAATIGDNVYIGPNVSIIEDVKIGNNVTIGAGSIVTKNIPDNATVAGNYAKVLNYNNPSKYINNRWNV